MNDCVSVGVPMPRFAGNEINTNDQIQKSGWIDMKTTRNEENTKPEVDTDLRAWREEKIRKPRRG